MTLFNETVEALVPFKDIREQNNNWVWKDFADSLAHGVDLHLHSSSPTELQMILEFQLVQIQLVMTLMQ